MTATAGRTIPLVLGLVALVAIPSNARAQGNTFNPYGNSGYEDYREFGSPKYATNPSLPGQSILNSEPIITRPRANSYQQYTQELEGDSAPGLDRRGTSNLPYYRAYQQLNRQYNRVYRPNDTEENRRFEDRLRLRDSAYAKALAESDPVKRAKLLRQVEQDSLNRPTSGVRRRPAAGAATLRPSQPAPATSSRAPSPYSNEAPPAPAERRTPAPLPFPSVNTRRPTVTSPAARAPASTRPGTAGTSTPRPSGATTAAPDPSTIPIPPPR